jgi:hypothetical protein
MKRRKTPSLKTPAEKLHRVLEGGIKKAKTRTPEERDEHFRRICDELGADVVEALHEAYRKTAAALYRRAAAWAEAQMKKTEG